MTNAEYRHSIIGYETVSMFDIEDILSGMYNTESDFPPFLPRYEREFEEKSYDNWAIKEIEDYISEYIYPSTSAYVDEVIDIIINFVRKMDHYISEATSENKKIFSHARNVAEELMRILSDS